MKLHSSIKGLFAAALATASLGVAAQAIKLGFNGDISASPTAQSGQVALLGIQAAIEDINKSGGLLGRQLTLLVRDDQAQPPRSLQIMNELIDNEKVAAVFGPTLSGNALAWRHIPNEKKTPVIVPIAAGTAVTKAPGSNNFIFRVSMVDRDQVAGLMAYVKKNPGSKRVGFFAETSGYGLGGLKDSEEIAALHGIKPVIVEKFEARDTDMTSQLNKAKAAGVDTVVVWAQSVPIAHLLRSMEKLNYFPLVLASWAAGNDAFVQVAGKNLVSKPLFMTTVADENSGKNSELYRRLANKIPNASLYLFAAQGYDAVSLFAAAVRQAKSIDGVKVKEALESLQLPLEGYVKTYKVPFSASQHEALGSSDFRWVRWSDGRVVSYSDSVTSSLKASDYKK
ncbi:ABC transporter substrate-binding protein [Ottowia thiooxydans]|uniref:ABC transporter substrate-binding protein n=1 Tax=Ottowia thiooxydans TaxID=219182 RepID=UPI00040328A9|nr:ABC transporter substrate-binding protein [Ottowia thiooxydans]